MKSQLSTLEAAGLLDRDFKDNPSYVIDEDARQLLSTEAARLEFEHVVESGEDMLPFPRMWVEFGLLHNAPSREFNGWHMVHMDAVERDDEQSRKLTANLYVRYFNASDGRSSRPVCLGAVLFDLSDGAALWLRNPDLPETVNDVSADDFRKFALGIAKAALRFAALSSRVSGLARDVIVAPEKLNRARVKRGHQPIRPYSYIHIGHVYDRDGVRQATGRSVKTHLRAAHSRRQHHGPGNRDVKIVRIAATVVNYDPAAELPRVERRVVL
jgi:hypothetical protein